jgi:hypothetical protein
VLLLRRTASLDDSRTHAAKEPDAGGGAAPRVRPVKVCQRCHSKMIPAGPIGCALWWEAVPDRARDDRRLALAGANRRRLTHPAYLAGRRGQTKVFPSHKIVHSCAGGLRRMQLTENFGFLGDHDPDLVKIGALAERYFRDDPPTALIKLRQFA